MRLARIAAIVAFALALSAPAHAQYQKYQTWCGVGGVKVAVPGTNGSTLSFQQSAPSCTVTVYDTGTVSLSTLYSDSTGTPKANPFTSASTGLLFFYADPVKHYDVVMSGGGLTATVTLSDVALNAPMGLPATLGTAGQQLTINPAATAAVWQSKGGVDARDYGVVAGTTDNASLVSTLMSAISTPAASSIGKPLLLPPTSTGVSTYYFSTGLPLSRAVNLDCGAGAGANSGSVIVVDAGYSGVTFENTTTSSDGGGSQYGSVSHCGIRSLGRGVATTTNTSASVTGLSINNIGSITAAPWATGDGIMAMFITVSASYGLTVPAGDYFDSVSGTSGTLHVAATGTQAAARAYRLPAALAISATFTNTSNTFTTSAGPCLKPGDVLWSDAYSFGSWVWSVSGSCGAQTVVVTTTGTSTDGAASYSGSGKVWAVPAAIKRRVQAYSFGNYINDFPIAIAMQCSSGMGLNCTSSIDGRNFAVNGYWGRYASGNNTGASYSYGNQFSHFANDVREDGSVGSYYSGDSFNSGGNDSNAPVIGNCANQNYSKFDGIYIETPAAAWNYSDRGTCGSNQGPQFIGYLNARPSDVTAMATGDFTGPSVLYTNLNGGAVANTDDAQFAMGDFSNQKAVAFSYRRNSAGTDTFRGQFDPAFCGSNSFGLTFANTTGPLCMSTSSAADGGGYLFNVRINTGINFLEGTALGGVASHDMLYADSTAHRLKMNNNNGGAKTVAATDGDTFTSTTLTSPVINTGISGTAINASANHAVCWKTATTLGFCSDAVGAGGTCTCN